MAGTWTGVREEFGKMSAGAKACAGICCCLVGVMSALGVAFIVTFFILTNKIAPFMAQAALGMSSINITNATVWMPSNLTENPWAEQVVHVTMSNPGPLPVTVKKFTQRMVMRGDYTFLTPEVNVTIASYEFPQQHLKPGDNHITVKVNMTILNNSLCGFNAVGQPTPCFGLFISQAGYVGLIPEIPAAFLSLESDDMEVKAMGLSVKGGPYSTFFKMSCKISDEQPPNPLNVSLEPACQALPKGCSAPAQIGCWQVADFSPPTTTTTTTETKATNTEEPEMEQAIL